MRPRTTLAGQFGLSIAATVVATLIVSAIQSELTAVRTAQPAPSLTSGGKFAARVNALRAEDSDAERALPPAPRIPLLVADTLLQAVPIHFVSDDDFSLSRPSPDGGKVAKRIVHAGSSRRRLGTDVASDVQPPRRSEAVMLAADTSTLTPVQADSSGVWPATKGLYRQAVDIGGAMLDRVNPLNLLP